MPAVELEGQAVLFIHGIGGAGRVWAGQLASSGAAGLVPLAPDLPGYGGRPPVAKMDFDGLAEDSGNGLSLATPPTSRLRYLAVSQPERFRPEQLRQPVHAGDYPQQIREAYLQLPTLSPRLRALVR